MIHDGLPRKRRVDREFQSQAALFAWARLPIVQRQLPGIDLLSCSLNGVKLTAAQAGKAKAAGMLKGEWDIKLPVARGPHIGLAIEMKVGRNRLTDDQHWYGSRLREEGWDTHVCYAWEDAKAVIVGYLSREAIAVGLNGSIGEPCFDL